jgi:tetratricopeptide (TPR) repeat protein
MGLISYKKRDDVVKAKKYFNRVVEADPTHIHAWMFKGEIEETVDDDFQAAYESLEMARDVNPDAHEVIHKEIELLMKYKKKFKKAVELSVHLKELKPKDSIALYVCGLGALKLDNDPEKALEYMNNSIKANPKNKRTIISKANILAEYLDRSSDAVSLLKAALKKSSDDHELWMELGMIYFDFIYDPHEAIKCFDMVTKLDKGSSDGWYNKGMILSRGFEKHQDGLKCLDQSTRLDDSNYLAWHEKGKILSEVYNMTDDAMKCYNKALSIEPEEGDVLISMANLMRSRKDLNSAIDHYTKAIEVDPTNINSHIYLAETYMSQKDHSSAQKALTSALQVEAKSERIWMMKAEVFRAENELGKAFECYKRVLRFNPDNQDALNKKTSIEAQLERLES